MERKDYFSGQSKTYAAFRPTYPEEMYRFIFQYVKSTSCAWDCATGNGQVAAHLAKFFDSVYATDISQQQLDQAIPSDNIFYSVGQAERSDFGSNTFDLITVAQALHWFHLNEFYSEVRRTAKKNALLAVWGYNLMTIDPTIDELVLDFYRNTTGPYWDPARTLVENEYRDVPFPFEQIVSPGFQIKIQWSVHQLAGYLNSWSATQKYISINGSNPVDAFKEALRSVWPEEIIKPVSFPIFLKLGRVNTHPSG